MFHFPLVVEERQRCFGGVEDCVDRQVFEFIGCVALVVVLVLAVEEGHWVRTVRVAGLEGDRDRGTLFLYSLKK